MKKLHFISGLPRSGSTMFAALLHQNPCFQAGSSSPLLAIVNHAQRMMTPRNEFSIALTNDQRRDMLRGLCEGLYKNSREIAFDNGKLWTGKLALIHDLYPDAKVLTLVRSLSWIMDSWERVFRLNPLEISTVYNCDPSMTVYQRVGKLASSEGSVGAAYDALRDGYYGEHRNKMLIIEYEQLVRLPKATMAAVYDFLEEPTFLHDFDHLDYHNKEFDRHIGAYRLHYVKPKVEYVERKTVLPPDLFAKFGHDDFWTSPKHIVHRSVG